MFLKTQNFEVITPSENYAEKLCYYMKYYLKLMDDNLNNKSRNRNENAKSVIRWIIFPNEKEFVKDFKYVRDKLDDKTFKMINQYKKCIMQLLGKIGECIIIDRCDSDPEMNIKCINFATFRQNIFECYKTIPYSEYIAFGTSFEHIIFKNQTTGLYEQRENLNYNPNDMRKDIGWCKRNNFLWQLRFENAEFGCANNAKLQVKVTLDCTSLKLDKYFKTFTPVICFDLTNDLCKIQNVPSYLLISARDINLAMEMEIEAYFRILGAYATGIISDFNLNDLKIKENPALKQLFNTPIIDIVTKERLKEVGVIDYIENFGHPIIIGT